jgi:dolichol-phosphate mannosyltransferase
MSATDGTQTPPGLPVELTVVVPAYNERDNVPRVVEELSRCLDGIRWEVAFVDDDSPDGTADAVREISRRDPRVRCIQRIGRRGLSSACIEGMLASAAPYLAVMDADLQHDPALLPKMLAELRSGELDIAVGSRYTQGGGIGNWTRSRAFMSRLANRLSQTILKANLSDRMSGYFMVRREVFADAVHRLSGLGFKILLDLFASSPRPLRCKEFPYTFRQRQAGESKLDSQAVWSYLMLLLDKVVGRWVPVRLVTFGVVGAFGVLVHMAVFVTAQHAGGLGFVTSQVLATLTAMVSNFAINNLLTYRDVRLRGWRWALGLGTFMLACSVGAITNVGVASFLFAQHYQPNVSALAGVLVSTVWNYAVTATYTWNAQQYR